MQRAYNRSETIELVIPPNTGKPQVNFDDIPELRSDSDKDCLIYAVMAYSAESVPNTSTGNPVASMAQLKNAFLTLYVLGTEKHLNIPLVDYLTIENSAGTYFFNRFQNDMQPQRVDWTKSFVSFPIPVNNGGANTQFSFYFKVIYDWYPPGTYAKYLENQQNLWMAGILKM